MDDLNATALKSEILQALDQKLDNVISRERDSQKSFLDFIQKVFTFGLALITIVVAAFGLKTCSDISSAVSSYTKEQIDTRIREANPKKEFDQVRREAVLAVLKHQVAVLRAEDLPEGLSLSLSSLDVLNSLFFDKDASTSDMTEVLNTIAMFAPKDFKTYGPQIERLLDRIEDKEYFQIVFSSEPMFITYLRVFEAARNDKGKRLAERLVASRIVSRDAIGAVLSYLGSIRTKAEGDFLKDYAIVPTSVKRSIIRYYVFADSENDAFRRLVNRLSKSVAQEEDLLIADLILQSITDFAQEHHFNEDNEQVKQQVKQPVKQVHRGWAKDILRTLIKEDYRLYSVRDKQLNTVSKLGISKGSERVVSSSGVLTNFVYAYGRSIIEEIFLESFMNSKGQIDAEFTSLVRFFSVIPWTRGKSEIDKRGLLDHAADLDRDSAILFTSGETIKLQVLRNGQLETEEAAGPLVIVEVPGKVERSESSREEMDKARLIGVIYRDKNGVRRFEVLKWLEGKKLGIKVLPLVDFKHYMSPYYSYVVF